LNVFNFQPSLKGLWHFLIKPKEFTTQEDPLEEDIVLAEVVGLCRTLGLLSFSFGFGEISENRFKNAGGME
jgi:hypothetical protein